MDSLGEQALRYATEPTYEGLYQILLRFHLLGEDLYSFLMKCLVHEYTLPLTLETNNMQVLGKIFAEAENNTKIGDLLKYMLNIESSIGIRFLIYCLQTTPGLYNKFSDKLERDLKSGMEDLSLQSLSWIFRKVFSLFYPLITSNIIHFYLQIATIDQIHQLELDIYNGCYIIIGDKLGPILESSAEFTSTEQIYLWKIISAEISPEKLDLILDIFHTNLCTQWDALSGLLHYLLSYVSFINTDHVKVLLSFPAKNFKNAIILVLTQVSSEIIEEAINFILLKSQFQGQINLLKHLKLWVEMEGKLGEIVKTKNLQNLLSSTLHSLSSDYFKEFSNLLEPKQLFPR